jgi:hypothetical protein
MASWFYLSNVKYFDVFAAFEAGVKYRPVKTNVSVGDTLYIYLAAPYKQIVFECEVVRTDIDQDEVIAEMIPFIMCDITERKKMKFIELGEITSFPVDEGSPLGYQALKDHGLRGRLMWPRNLDNTPGLLGYIKEVADALR